MPKPEIARRCQSCGVSIRVRAGFCPHCGKKLTRKQDGAIEVNEAESLTPRDPSAADTLPIGTTLEPPRDNSRSPTGLPLNSDQRVDSPPAIPTSPAPSRQPMQATVGMVHRAGTPPRQVSEEQEPNRVEKFRQMSSAMIDGASYDPSLRFLLVAAVLFVLFLLFLLMSELIS